MKVRTSVEFVRMFSEVPVGKLVGKKGTSGLGGEGRGGLR